MTKEKTTQAGRGIRGADVWKPYMLGIAVFIALAITAYTAYWWGSRSQIHSLSDPDAPLRSPDVSGIEIEPESAESVPESIQREAESRILDMETQP